MIKLVSMSNQQDLATIWTKNGKFGQVGQNWTAFRAMWVIRIMLLGRALYQATENGTQNNLLI